MKKVFQAILLAALVACLVYIYTGREKAAEASAKVTPLPVHTDTQSESSLSPDVATTPSPTPEPTPEPTPVVYTFSFVGDNTLWSTSRFENSPVGLPMTVGDDYSYPYSNTISYFKDDEMTFANLECSFSAESIPHDYTVTTFPFLAKPEYVKILTENSVEFVTMANNHTMDFFEKGVTSTRETLESAGLPYGDENQGQIVTSKSGLKVGIWTAGRSMVPDQAKAVEGVKKLRSDGADIVVCMFHWGQELHYEPLKSQIDLAHACIDAGADIIYGSHSHCLQPIEEYNGKVIMYSLGNWVFGGNTMPSDPDTAIIQVNIKKDVDGTISIEGYKAIPCAITSNLDLANTKANNPNYMQDYNDYKPTPYPEDNEGYARVISKLNGTSGLTSQNPDYSNYYASFDS